MPTEDLKWDSLVKTGSFQAVDEALLMMFLVVNEVVNFECIPNHLNNCVVLRIELPVAVVIKNIQEPDCLVSKLLPSLQTDQQSLHPRIEVGVVQERDQIFNIKLVVHDSIYLLIVPFLIINIKELSSFICNLVKNNSIVIKSFFVIWKVVEPQTGIEAKLSQ